MENDQVSLNLSRLRKLPVVEEALLLLATKLPSNLRYHVASHTDDVMHEVVLFGTSDTIEPRALELPSIAAAFHDVGFTESGKENERIGAAMAEETMIRLGGYSSDETQCVTSMILDTQVHQTTEGLRQVPSTPLASYLLDADVSNLGREDFSEKAELVRLELAISDVQQFYTGLAQFLAAHQWYSPAAQRLRQAQKERNVQWLREMLEQGRFTGRHFLQ